MELQSFYDISQAADKVIFRRRLIDFAHAMDFPLVSGVLVLGVKKNRRWHYVGNAPADFSESTDKSLMGKDPVLARLQTTTEPFLYDQHFYVAAGMPELWEIASPYGYRTGIAVKLPIEGVGQFLFGLDRERPIPKSRRLRSQLFADLCHLAAHCQDAAQRLLADTDVASGNASLTQRECEVLKWTKEGKSSWVVGQILSVSEFTVNFHLRNAIRKLGASSKHGAVLKAISLGIFSP